MSESKPAPLFAPRAQRPLCPVCGEPSYSRRGIHPQCAEKRSAAARDLAVQVGRTPSK